MKNVMRRLAGVLTVLLLWASSAAAGPAIFVVRHAERADSGAPAGMMSADPDLSPAGQARAAALAQHLRDAKISAIYVTEYRRTAQTAEPLAGALGTEPIRIPAKDVGALLRQLESATGNVLVVGHSNSVPEILKGLGVAEPVTIDEAEFDNLFVVIRGAPSTCLRLRY